MTTNLAAFTAHTFPFPPFISAGLRDDGQVVVMFRLPPPTDADPASVICPPVAEISMTPGEWNTFLSNAQQAPE